MKRLFLAVLLATTSAAAVANSETKTFTATDDGRVKACARAKEDAQHWVRVQMSPPYVVSQGTVWKPTDAKYSSCDCDKPESDGETNCAIDATLSN